MFIRLAFVILLLLPSWLFAADENAAPKEWIVVVNSESTVNVLSHKQVIGLFLGRSKFLPSGERARAVDYPVESQARASFYQSLTGKNIADIDAYWARLQYSGRARPPTPISGTEQMVQYVSTQTNAIGYLPSHLHSQLSEHGLKPVFVLVSKNENTASR